MKEKVMLIGGAGFIGSELAKQIKSDKYEIVIYDGFIQYTLPLNTNYNEYLKYRFKDMDDVKFIRGDTRDATFLRRTLLKEKPEYIVHLAALPIDNISSKNSDETVSSILLGLVNVLEVLRDTNFLKKFVYISSSMVYGDFQYNRPDENHPTNPKNLYGCFKLCGEITTKTYGERYNIPYSIVRPSAVYGPTDLNRRVSQIFIESIISEEKIIVKGRNTKLDFTFVNDTAKGIKNVLFSENSFGETYNITCGVGYTLKDFIQIAEQVIGKKAIVEYRSADKNVPIRGALNIDKALKSVGYYPEYLLSHGLNKYLKFYKEIGKI